MLNDKRVPCIPPIFHDNKFITDCSKKADLFNSFFAKQCSIIENNSVLPSSTNPITDQYLASIEFMKDDIKRIIRNLDPNKAHGHDMISIRMLKMSGDFIIEPLFKIFKNCLKCGIFPDHWKKGNIVPTFKKGDKQNIKNYRPVSLLPNCSKILQRMIYDNMLKYFSDNNLISPKQSGVRPGDSCINQLLSITNDIFTSFDNGLEVRGVFLDISKTFDRMWHDGRKTKQDKRQPAMSFNRLFEKSPTKSSFKWSVLIMDKGECRHSTRINFGTFIGFDLHKRLAKRFTV